MELNVICSQLYQLLSVIQGIALHHTASKVYLGRRYPLEVGDPCMMFVAVLNDVVDSSSVVNDVAAYVHDYTATRWQLRCGTVVG